VFQSYSLMPWLTVRENIALAVDRVFAAENAAARSARVKHYVSMVGLSAAIDKKPAQLSGGMRQRVAVARALATDPDVLLLDEPLSALDALTRATLQDEIVRIWGEDRKTVLMITNDVDEALMVADRIIALQTGPGAKLGPSFTVDIPRPRDRREMNHHPRFQTLRGEITQHLLELAHKRDAARGAQVIPLPALAPKDVAVSHRRTAASLFPAAASRCTPMRRNRSCAPSALSSSRRWSRSIRRRRARRRWSTASTSSSSAASSSRSSATRVAASPPCCRWWPG
jgi:nitrate/nitrite transport system ATP-binding protein